METPSCWASRASGGSRSPSSSNPSLIASLSRCATWPARPLTVAVGVRTARAAAVVSPTPVRPVLTVSATRPANTNVLVLLVSFGVSGIYLSFLLTVIGAIVARSRGWIPEGRFRLGRWAWPVTIVAALYLLLMLVNLVAPTGLTSPRAYFNLDWITLVVMFVVAVVGVIFFLVAHSGRELSAHMRDDAETPAAAAKEG